MKNEKVSRCFPYAFIALSALLSAMPYSLSFLSFLSWFSFVPLIVVLLRRNNRFRADLVFSLFFGFLYHLFTYWWFYVLYPMEFAGVSKPEAALIVFSAHLGISILHGTLFFLPGVAVHLAKKIAPGSAFPAATFAVSFLLTEYLTELGALAFPWLRVSMGQYRAPVLLQLASLFGVYGTDLLILAVNACLAVAFVTKKKRRLGAGILAASLFGANFLFGAIRLYLPQNTGAVIDAAAVQGNILSGEKWADGSADHCMEVYSDLTNEAAEKQVDLVVWPETALPVDLSRDYNALYREKIGSLAKKIDAPILTGSFWSVENGEANAAVLFTEEGVSEPYAKRHLVPFGEKVPYRAFFETCFPFLTEINMLSEDLAAGKDTALFETENGRVGAVICFESVFPGLVRDSVNDGAGLLVIVTNDSWYKDSPAAYQHLSHAVLRSIENGKSVVRAANSGVSALVDHRGRIISELGPLKKGIVAGKVSFSGEKTLYSIVGDAVCPASAALLVIWGAFSFVRTRRRHGGNK